MSHEKKIIKLSAKNEFKQIWILLRVTKNM